MPRQRQVRSGCRLEESPFSEVRWLPLNSDPEDFKGMYLGANVRLATDNDGQLVLLFPDEWAVNYFAEKNEDITLIKHSPLQGDTI